MCVTLCIALVGSPFARGTSADEVLVAQSLAYLGTLQDSTASGLVPLLQGEALTTTYVNATTAIAFVLGGQPDRARRIFDVFAKTKTECPCACPEGFHQFRDANTGQPDAATDCWVGDNAWLVTALKVYATRTGDPQYDPLIERLKAWMQCLKANSPEPGIIGGYRPSEACVAIPPHPEGSIDVYGALYGLGAESLRASILQWISQEVWIPQGDCFDRGPMNSDNLPNDHCSWGYLALGTDHPDYSCILSYADRLHARSLGRYRLEAWDRDGLWFLDREDPSIQVQFERQSHGDADNFHLTYTIPPNLNWFRIYRFQDVDFRITPALFYEVSVRSDGPVPNFEVKFSQKGGGPTCVYTTHSLSDGWNHLEIPFSQFNDFGSPGPCLVDRVGQIEFAVNFSGQGATDRHLEIASLTYGDGGKPYLFPVHGFAAFESDQNHIFVEGTGSMADAYCVARREPEWRFYLDALSALTRPRADATRARPLPSQVTGSEDDPPPNPVAAAWFVMAAHCINPFAP